MEKDPRDLTGKYVTFATEDPYLRDRNGQIVHVFGRNDGHPDFDEIGTMWIVEFPDGEQNLAIHNELFED